MEQHGIARHAPLLFVNDFIPRICDRRVTLILGSASLQFGEQFVVQNRFKFRWSAFQEFFSHLDALQLSRHRSGSVQNGLALWTHGYSFAVSWRIMPLNFGKCNIDRSLSVRLAALLPVD
jgi:hypothetical protein